MSTSATKPTTAAPPTAGAPPLATGVAVRGEMLTLGLSDGRVLAAPLVWSPRLWHGTPAERGRWRLVGLGEGVVARAAEPVR